MSTKGTKRYKSYLSVPVLEVRKVREVYKTSYFVPDLVPAPRNCKRTLAPEIKPRASLNLAAPFCRHPDCRVLTLRGLCDSHREAIQ